MASTILSTIVKDATCLRTSMMDDLLHHCVMGNQKLATSTSMIKGCFLQHKITKLMCASDE
eukprot:535711-Amphidinium_carterae.1